MAHDCCAPTPRSTLPEPLRLAQIFVPDTTVYADRVYFEAPSAADYADWLEFTDADLTLVQALANHQHILDFFGDVEVSRADLLAFGYLLQTAWQALMQSRYPDREIVIAFDPQDEDTLDEIQINLYEESAA